MTTAVDKQPTASRLLVVSAGDLPTAPAPPQLTQPLVAAGSHRFAAPLASLNTRFVLCTGSPISRNSCAHDVKATDPLGEIDCCCAHLLGAANQRPQGLAVLNDDDAASGVNDSSSTPQAKLLIYCFTAGPHHVAINQQL